MTNNGSGVFAVADVVGGAETARDIAVGDLNQDGDPDIVVATESRAVSVLLGGPGATLQAPVNHRAGPTAGVTDVAVGDVDRDGHLDAALRHSGTSVSVMTGMEPGSCAGRPR